MKNTYFDFKVGAFDCATISDGSYNYPPKNFFSNVLEDQLESVLIEHGLPTEHVTTPYSCLFINTGTHKIMVDIGAGRWQWAESVGGLPENLKDYGVELEEIDTIIITHAHPDHVGGNLDEDGNPICPNAHYFISKVEWDFWFSEGAEKQAPEGHVKGARRNLEPIRERVTLLDQEGEILLGITLIQTPGHTPGHIALEIESNDQYLLHVSDTVLHPLHLEYPDWTPVYDILPDKATSSKQKIFNRAADENLMIFAHHFPPFPNLGYVEKRDSGWRWRPLESSG